MIEAFSNISTAFGLSSSAGLNAYLPLLVVALISRYTDLITLNEPWQTLTNGWVIIALCVFRHKCPVDAKTELAIRRYLIRSQNNLRLVRDTLSQLYSHERNRRKWAHVEDFVQECDEFLEAYADVFNASRDI